MSPSSFSVSNFQKSASLNRAQSESEYSGQSPTATGSAISSASARIAKGIFGAAGSVRLDFLQGRVSKDDSIVSYKVSKTDARQSPSYAFKKDLLKNPFEVYSNLSRRLSAQSHRALFPEFAGAIQYLKEQLNHPFVLDSMKGNKFMEHAHKLCMLELSHIAFEFVVSPTPGLVYPHEPPVNGLYPYHSSIGAIRTVLDFFDNLERSTKDNVPDLYHSDRYTYHDQNLQFNPEFIEIPSECVFTLRDFVRLRGVPVAVMGVTAKTTFADSYYNSPRDFWVHDANHSRRLHSANQQYFKRNNITTEEGRQATYLAWDRFIEKQVMPATQITSALSPDEKNLRKMVKVALFEVYHEQALTPSKEDLLGALKFQPGGGSAFEMILDPKAPEQSYEKRRLKNFNIDSGTAKYQSDMAPRTIKYFHQSAPNFITNLYDKLTREFYDNRYGSIGDLPETCWRTPELVADALVRVTQLYDIGTEELGFENTPAMRSHFVNMARNHDDAGNQIGQQEIYHQKQLNKPALKSEAVEHILNVRRANP